MKFTKAATQSHATKDNAQHVATLPVPKVSTCSTCVCVDFCLHPLFLCRDEQLFEIIAQLKSGDVLLSWPQVNTEAERAGNISSQLATTPCGGATSHRQHEIISAPTPDC